MVLHENNVLMESNQSQNLWHYIHEYKIKTCYKKSVTCATLTALGDFSDYLNFKWDKSFQDKKLLLFIYFFSIKISIKNKIIK